MSLADKSLYCRRDRGRDAYTLLETRAPYAASARRTAARGPDGKPATFDFLLRYRGAAPEEYESTATTRSG